MEHEGFEMMHPLAHKVMVVIGFVAAFAVGSLAIPLLADKLSARMIKNSASIEIPNEGPAIERDNSADGR